VRVVAWLFMFAGCCVQVGRLVANNHMLQQMSRLGAGYGESDEPVGGAGAQEPTGKRCNNRSSPLLAQWYAIGNNIAHSPQGTALT